MAKNISSRRQNQTARATPQEISVRQSITQAEFHQGPLPPAATFAQYDEVVPGAAERLLAMAEKDAEHVREVEMIAVRASRIEGVIARLAAAAVPIVAICGSVYVCIQTQTVWPGILLGLGGLSAPLIAAFLKR